MQTIHYEYLNGVGDYHVLIERLEFDDGSKSFRQSHWDIEQRKYVIGTKGMIAVPFDAPSFKEASIIYWAEGAGREDQNALYNSIVAYERLEDITQENREPLLLAPMNVTSHIDLAMQEIVIATKTFQTMHRLTRQSSIALQKDWKSS